MKSFLAAFKEFLEWQTVSSTTPRIVWINDKWTVTVYYSNETIKRIGGEVVHG